MRMKLLFQILVNRGFPFVLSKSDHHFHSLSAEDSSGMRLPVSSAFSKWLLNLSFPQIWLAAAKALRMLVWRSLAPPASPIR